MIEYHDGAVGRCTVCQSGPADLWFCSACGDQTRIAQRRNLERNELDQMRRAIAEAMTMWQLEYPDGHAGPCSHVACRMYRRLVRGMGGDA